jgi:hypothetical protein
MINDDIQIDSGLSPYVHMTGLGRIAMYHFDLAVLRFDYSMFLMGHIDKDNLEVSCKRSEIRQTISKVFRT